MPHVQASLSHAEDVVAARYPGRVAGALHHLFQPDAMRSNTTAAPTPRLCEPPIMTPFRAAFFSFSTAMSQVRWPGLMLLPASPLSISGRKDRS